MRLPLLLTFTASMLIATAAPAQAGMPAPFVMTEMGRMRLESLSFFLMLFLLSAFLIKLFWNLLRKDFPAIPRLTYLKALGVTTLWGLMFILVLTMISGARELLTPGAWERSGATYKLTDKAAPAPTFPTIEDKQAARRLKVEELRFALWDYARKNAGKFPETREKSGFAPETWEVDDPSRMKFIYHAGNASGSTPLAYEPDIFDGKRFVLLANGEIKLMGNEELLDRISKVKP